MSATKWTPASERWQLDRSDPEDGFDGFVIMRDAMVVSTFDGPQSDERQRRRALLCAAAPDMAEALEKLLGWEDAIRAYIPNGGLASALTAARAALAKARGET